MKKYIVVLMFLIGLLPVTVNAEEVDKFACDNAPYEFILAHRGVGLDRIYALGEPGNRNKYIDQVLDFCNREDIRCDGYLIGDKFFSEDGKETLRMNYPTFSILVNNKDVFDLLVKNGFAHVIDHGYYLYERSYHNSRFLTPAFIAIKFSQVGLLEYLIKEYNVNLLKKWGYIYWSKNKPQELRNALDLAEEAIEFWKERNDYRGVQCALATQKVVKDWFNKYKDSPLYNNEELKAYNDKLDEIAHQPRYMSENINPNEGENPANLYETHENYAKNEEIQKYIENLQIDNFIRKILKGLDLSIFGNKALS